MSAHWIRSLGAAFFLFPFCLFHDGYAGDAHCATFRYFQEVNAALGASPETTNGARAKIAASLITSKPMAERPYARTWVTPHFVLNYSLFGLHQVKMTAADSALARRTALIAEGLANPMAPEKDSLIYAQLDEEGIPHPEYVQVAAQAFEAAWAYYVDTLAMRPPSGRLQSLAYRAPGAAQNRYVVDIADIGTYDSFYRGEYYGLTFPPPNLAIVLENDFLWNTRLSSTGEVIGDTVQSRLNGKVIHNYSREYELGLRLTIYHEFYHAIQFTYVPNHPHGYHAWYELSAVGMEIRKVPDGKDYFQYLPCLFNQAGKFGLFDTGGGFCNPAAEYSNAPFHYYLTRKVGEDFDALTWQHLAQHGDDIKVSLPAALQERGRSLAQTWPDYAAHLLLAGLSSRPDQFIPEMPDWPAMAAPLINPDNITGSLSYELAPLSYLPIRLTPAFTGGRVVAKFSGDSSALEAIVKPDSLLLETFASKQVLLPAPRDSGQAWLVMTNLDVENSSQASLTFNLLPFRAYPNPLSLKAADALEFTRSQSVSLPARIEIRSENGQRVFLAQYSSLQDEWKWDLFDEKKRKATPGIYHLKLNQNDWQTLLLLP